MKSKQLLKNILLYLGIVFVVSLNILTNELGSLDEIWIFNSTMQVAKRTFTI